MPKATWLADVLKEAGLKVVEEKGWKSRGHGTMKGFYGIVLHHTAGAKEGNFPALNVVKNGRPGLSGPLANLGLARDGTWYIIAAGKAWHAGRGSYEWEDSNIKIVSGNEYLLGVEAENTGLANDIPWPKEQYDSYVKGVAAILSHLELPAERAIGHKEWTTRKIDPTFSMSEFRNDVEMSMMPLQDAVEKIVEDAGLKLPPLPDRKPEPEPEPIPEPEPDRDDNAYYAKGVLVGLGWSEIQASALIGNAMVESGEELPTGSSSKSGVPYGILKWYTARKKLLEKFAKQNNMDVENLTTQVRFMDWELRNTEKAVYTELKNSMDMMSALRAVVGYVRPAGYKRSNPEGSSRWKERVVAAFGLL